MKLQRIKQGTALPARFDVGDDSRRAEALNRMQAAQSQRSPVAHVPVQSSRPLVGGFRTKITRR